MIGEQDHQTQHDAIVDFLAQHPNGQAIFDEAARAFAHTLYENVVAETDSRYFLDKTPRYTLISNDILRAFPDAKFIALVRHPLSIAASVFSTWNKAYWNPAKHHADFYTGMEKLALALEKNEKIILKVSYEDLVSAPEEVVNRICRFLEIEFEPSVLTDFAKTRFEGRMGDPTGVARYSSISSESLSSWRLHCRGFVRKFWLRRWIRKIGQQRLNTLGYDESQLLNDIANLPNFYVGLPRDLVSQMIWMVGLALQSAVLRGKIRTSGNWMDRPWL